MSVTFKSSRSEIFGWTAETWCGEIWDEEDLILDRQEAEEQLAAHVEACEDPQCATGSYIWPVQSIEPVHWANSNAASVLDLLGYDTDQLVGSAPAEEMLYRTERELAWVSSRGDSNFARRLEQLREIARQTVNECGGEVTWG